MFVRAAKNNAKVLVRGWEEWEQKKCGNGKQNEEGCERRGDGDEMRERERRESEQRH